MFGTRPSSEKIVALYPDAAEKLAGTTAIVTGASSGTGMETTYQLAKLGALVIMAVRNVEKGKECIKILNARANEEGIKIANEDQSNEEKSLSLNLKVMKLELSDLESVKNFLEEFENISETLPPLKTLVNNAGMFKNDIEQSSGDYDIRFATNHLGHYALTNGLLPTLRKNKPARIVILSSMSHLGPLSIDESAFDSVENLKNAWAMPKSGQYSSFSAMKFYGDTKLANVLHAMDLNDREMENGITACSVHPGFVKTNIINQSRGFLAALFRLVAQLFAINVNQGTATTMFAILAPSEEVAGEYCSECKVAKKNPLATMKAVKTMHDLSESLML